MDVAGHSGWRRQSCNLLINTHTSNTNTSQDGLRVWGPSLQCVTSWGFNPRLVQWKDWLTLATTAIWGFNLWYMSLILACTVKTSVKDHLNILTTPSYRSFYYLDPKQILKGELWRPKWRRVPCEQELKHESVSPKRGKKHFPKRGTLSYKKTQHTPW